MHDLLRGRSQVLGGNHMLRQAVGQRFLAASWGQAAVAALHAHVFEHDALEQLIHLDAGHGGHL